MVNGSHGIVVINASHRHCEQENAASRYEKHRNNFRFFLSGLIPLSRSFNRFLHYQAEDRLLLMSESPGQLGFLNYNSQQNPLRSFNERWTVFKIFG